ncbi:MAG: NAD(P)/FAD-dependent oxidoreductase [Negativicutes bacterium]|nr:NAD(P)/FAD-dependent oxidoreductase [Negativicutes bacterium]
MTTQIKLEAKTDLLDKGAVLQRDRETYAIVPHIPGGIILDPNILRQIADIAEKYQAKALKLTSAQRIAIVGIAPEDIDKAWQDLGMKPGAALGLCVRSVKICPATHFCKRAQQDAVTLGLALDEKYHSMKLPSKFKIGISGCMNSCSECAVKDMGFIGTPKGFHVLIGGNAGVRPRLGNVLMENIAPEDVLPMADKIVEYYKTNARNFERMGMLIDRLGFEAVKQGILST